jgi:hypothetical protein
MDHGPVYADTGCTSLNYLQIHSSPSSGEDLCVYLFLFKYISQTHKEKHNINKMEIFNMNIQNKLKGAKSNK